MGSDSISMQAGWMISALAEVFRCAAAFILVPLSPRDSSWISLMRMRQASPSLLASQRLLRAAHHAMTISDLGSFCVWT